VCARVRFRERGLTVKTVLQHKNDIIKKMKALKVYKPEFEHAINGLARALYDMERTIELFDESGGQIIVEHTNKAGATNVVKNPFYLAIETLRQDIIIYSRELGLTPAALKRINDQSMKQEKQSPLEEALRRFDA